MISTGGVGEFIDTIDGLVAEILGPLLRIHCGNLSQADISCQEICVTSIDLMSDPSSSMYFVDLGTAVLDFTKSNNVLCYGGGACCLAEHLRTKDLVTWRLIPTSRFKQGCEQDGHLTDSNQEKCFFDI